MLRASTRSGQSSTVTGASVSIAAASMGSTAFFAQPTSNSPQSRLPPLTRNIFFAAFHGARPNGPAAGASRRTPPPQTRTR